MKCGAALALSAFVLGVNTRIAPAQDTTPAFLERARSGTGKYRDQSTAILEGYRRIGPDFPAMGEHWIRLDLLFDGKIQAEQPEILTYISVGGKARLTGVAYALPLLPGESPPDLPAPKEAWHDHFRTIEDETHLPLHHPPAAGDEPRITMLHVWLWLPNPDGLFATDNWTIPYARLGSTRPEYAPPSAAAALSLMTGGVEHFSAVVNKIAAPTTKQRAKINAAFATARSAVEREARENRDARLSEVWNRLRQSLQSVIDPKWWKDVQTALP